MKYRVFISSVIDELKGERHAAQNAIEELSRNPYNLHFEPAMFEHFGARSESVREAYKEEVRRSDIYLGIIGKKYGTFIDESGLSATHEEYRTAYDENKIILIYVLDIDERKDVREERVKNFINELKRHTYSKFRNEDQLKDKIKTDLSREWKKAIQILQIQVPSDHPPDVSEFINRETCLEYLKNSLDKNMILIQGIAGMGKTQVAAKLRESIQDKYITYWKELRKRDTFESVIRSLAVFLRNKNDPELAEYIEDGGMDHDVIISILLRSLENKRYMLFFDNYHVVERDDIHDLFAQLKDELEGSTIVITTRSLPSFVSPLDQVLEDNLGGFDLSATKRYLEQMGVNVSQNPLDKIDEKIGGHPYSLKMFASLARKMAVGEILKNLPDTGIEKYLHIEIFKRLENDELEILKALSVFRTPVTADACVQVAGSENVRITLISLEEKLLLNRVKNSYYLHDLIKDFSYSHIDNPKGYHRRAGKYYAELEKTPENILETAYHLVKDIGVVNDEVIDYLMEAPRDNYTRFVILGILDSNEITTTRSFELLGKFLSDENIEIQSLAVSILVKNRHLDIDRTLGILEQVIGGNTSPHLIKRTIQYLSKFEEERLDDILRMIGQIVQSKRYEYYWSILVLIKDLGTESPEIIEILREIATTQLSDLRWYNNRKEAFELLIKMGVNIFPEATQIDYLRELRQMTPEQALDYVERLAHPDEEGTTDIHLFGFDHNFLFFILRELYKVRPYETCILMKHFLAILERNPFQHIFEILGEHKHFNSEIIRSFVESDNRIISLTGFMALEYALNKVVDGEVVNVDEEIKNEILRLLREIMTWEERRNPLLSAMATVTYEEATNPSEQERIGLGSRIKTGFVKGAVERLGPRMVKNFMTAADSEIKEYHVVLYWGSYRGILHTKPDKLREVFSVIGKENEMFLRVCNFMYDQLRISPEGALDILYKFAFKSEESQIRVGAVDLANIVGRLAPEKVLEIYRELLSQPEYQDNRTRLCLTHNHRNFLETSQRDRAWRNLEMLMNDNDRQVGMLADIILNGIQFRE